MMLRVNQPLNGKDVQRVKTFGYFSLLLSAAFLLLFAANSYSRAQQYAPNWSWLGYIALYALVVGIGLVRIHKWAIVIFVLSLLALGVLLPFFSVRRDHEFYTILIALAFAVLLCWPAVSAIRILRRLT